MQSQKLVLAQKQQLKMSPQMFQSLELLALPILDLRQRIQEEIEKNPALELTSERAVSIDKLSEGPSRDTDYFENSSDPGFTSRVYTGADADSKQKFMEGALARSESLQDHLVWQLRMSPLSREETELGEILISNLDDNGFYQKPLEEVITPQYAPLLPKVLDIIRNFDPPGICVEGPIESLAVQAALLPDHPKHAVDFITCELELLRKGRFEELAKKYEISVEEVEDIFAFIKTLNPFPGSGYSSTNTEYVVPDITIRKHDSQLRLYIHDDQLPELKIDEQFSTMGEGEQITRETERYIQRAVKDAQWLISSVSMRRNTLRKMGAALMKHQFQFFLKGQKHLKPMTLKDIAEEISVHETTVSRLSHAKYVQTDWGVFPLKYFFSSALSSTNPLGEEYAKNSVKEIMRELIESYSGKKRLSDQKISDMLAEKGIKIARRTVAKYRGELHIESSFDR